MSRRNDKTYEDGVMDVINRLFDAADDYSMTVLDELLHESGIFKSCRDSGETINLLLGESFCGDESDEGGADDYECDED